MTKCVMCDKETEKINYELCKTCFEFFKSKHKKKLRRKLTQYRKTKEYVDKWKSSGREVKE